MKPQTPFILGAIAVATLGLVYVMRKGTGNVAQDLGQTIGTGAVDMASGITSGVVYGISDSVGVPRTDLSACDKARAEGRTLDASFACPAGTFIKYLFN